MHLNLHLKLSQYLQISVCTSLSKVHFTVYSESTSRCSVEGAFDFHHHKTHSHWAVLSVELGYNLSPILGSHYKLHVIMGIFARKIVGWEAWNDERAEYTVQLIHEAKLREKVWKPLALHQDKGSPMKATILQAILTKLGITAFYSRPRVSNDNPFLEVGFKTFKYLPNYPSKGFQSINQVRQWVQECIIW